VTQDPWLSPEQQWQAPGGGASDAVPAPPSGGAADGFAAPEGLVAAGPPAAYPMYPAGYPMYAGYAPPAPLKPPRPGTVSLATGFMIAGTVLSFLTMLVIFGSMETIDSRILMHSFVDAVSYDSEHNGVVAVAWILGLIGVGLWIWMTIMCHAGRHWARVTGTVFFGIGCLVWLGVLFDDIYPGVIKLLVVLTFGVSVTAVVLLWRGTSGAYFRPRSGFEGYPVAFPAQYAGPYPGGPYPGAPYPGAPYPGGQYPGAQPPQYPGQTMPGVPRHLQGRPVQPNQPGQQAGPWPGHSGDQPPGGEGPRRVG
jgi:hypothetical protein